jgi:GNAT superfamily N-acetyltransferase
MISLRPCETDSDYEAWLAVRRAVLPNERAPGLDELRSSIKPGDLNVLAELDGGLAGSGLVNRSDTGNAHVAPRVLPDKRGRGVGTALLEHLTAHALSQGYSRAGSHVAGDDDRSIAFAHRFGFEELRRDVQQVLEVGASEARGIDGVEFVSLEENPDLLEAAYPLAQEGYEDMPIEGLDISLETWLLEGGTLPEGSFAALADGEIVGYAGLLRWADEPTKAEHGLTVVRRDWRRRGLASALKERQIEWAAANGVRRLVTYTQTGNESMQAVNARLGYVTTDVTVAFTRALPL